MLFGVEFSLGGVRKSGSSGSRYVFHNLMTTKFTHFSSQGHLMLYKKVTFSRSNVVVERQMYCSIFILLLVF